MASYLQGISDYIPALQPFVPDYNFYAQAQQMKTSKADAAREQLSTLYGSLLNAPLTREDNTATRDKLFKTVEQDIKKVSGLDLSLEQNVNTAKTLFDPILENKNMIKDMVWTKNSYDQRARSKGFKDCIDPAKCGGGWWEGGDRLLDYQIEAFRRATPEEALHMADAEFVPRQDVVKMSMDLAKAADLNVTKDVVTGQWITTTKNGPLISGTLESLFQGTLARDPKVKAYYKAEMELARKDFMFNNESAYGSLESAEQAYIDLIAPEIEKQDPHYVEQAEDKVKTTQAKVDMINAAAKDATPNKKSKLEQIRDDYVKLGEAYAATADETKQVAGTVQVAKNNKKYTGEQIDDILAYYALSKDIMGAAEIMAQKDMESKKTANPYGLEAQQYKNRVDFEAIAQKNRIDLQNLRNQSKSGKKVKPSPQVSPVLHGSMNATQNAIVAASPILSGLFTGTKAPTNAEIWSALTQHGLTGSKGIKNPVITQPQIKVNPPPPVPAVPSGVNKGTPGLPGVTGGLPQNPVTPDTTPNAGTVNNPPVPQPVVQNPTVQNPVTPKSGDTNISVLPPMPPVDSVYAASINPVQKTGKALSPAMTVYAAARTGIPDLDANAKEYAETFTPMQPTSMLNALGGVTYKSGLAGKYDKETIAAETPPISQTTPVMLRPPARGSAEANIPINVPDIPGATGLVKDAVEAGVKAFTQFSNDRAKIDFSGNEKTIIGTVLNQMLKHGTDGNVQAQEDYITLLKNIAYTAGTSEYDIDGAPPTGNIMIGNMPIPNDMVASVIDKIDKIPTTQDKFNRVKTIQFNINKLPPNRTDNIYQNLVTQMGSLDDAGNQVLRDYLHDTLTSEPIVAAKRNIAAKSILMDQLDQAYAGQVTKVIGAVRSHGIYSPVWGDAFEAAFDDNGHMVDRKTFTQNMASKGYDPYVAWSLYRGDVDNTSDLPLVKSVMRSIASDMTNPQPQGSYTVDDKGVHYTVPNKTFSEKQAEDPAYKIALGKEGLFDQWKRAFSDYSRPSGDQAWLGMTGAGGTHPMGMNFKQVDPAEEQSLGTTGTISYLKEAVNNPTAVFSPGYFSEKMPKSDPAIKGLAQYWLDETINMKSGSGRPIFDVTYSDNAVNSMNKVAMNIKLNPVYANAYLQGKIKNDILVNKNDLTEQVLKQGITVYMDKTGAKNIFTQGSIESSVNILAKYADNIKFDTHPEYVQNFKLQADKRTGDYVATGMVRAGYNADGSEYWHPFTKTFASSNKTDLIVRSLDDYIDKVIKDNKILEQEQLANKSK